MVTSFLLAMMALTFSATALSQSFEVLHSFTLDGAAPNSLIQGTNGDFYSTTYSGGANGYGTVFRMDSAGSLTVLHNFAGSPNDGAYPYAALVETDDGSLYGTTEKGGFGRCDEGCGTVFKVDPSGNLTVVHSFTGIDGESPLAALIQATDGNLYGTTLLGGANNVGSIFRLDRSGKLTTLHSFAGGTDGERPVAGLIQAADGNFYGTTEGSIDSGSCSTCGTVFEMDLSGKLTTLHSFTGGSDGGRPFAGLIQASNGSFYGTTYSGGANGSGTVFRIDSAGGLTVLHSFARSLNEGTYPYAALVQAGDGNLYGTTYAGGVECLDGGCGTTFKIDTAGNLTTLLKFGGGDGGALPVAALIQAADGNFYGTTSTYGVGGYGLIFRMDSAGNLTVLHSFGTNTGAAPNSLVQGTDGNFYGTTPIDGHGAVFRMDSAGNLTVIHRFSFNDGSYPVGGLIQAADGNFYGTTYTGGAYRYGTAFRMDASGSLTVLHSFDLGGGANPNAGLIQAPDGNFYGTLIYGGAAALGAVFRMDPSGNVTTLHAFSGGLDGGGPAAGLIQAADGNFYGTSVTAGANGHGTVFKMDSVGNLTTLHSFAGGSDGSYPFAGLIQASDGNFYGTTEEGGGADSCERGCGTVFRMSPSGKLTTLHSFMGGSEGRAPVAGLIQAADGDFYGTTSNTVFKIDSAGKLTTLYYGNDSFEAALVQASDGRLYGTAGAGGAGKIGFVFRLTPSARISVAPAPIDHLGPKTISPR